MDQLRQFLFFADRHLPAFGDDQALLLHTGHFPFERRTRHAEIFGQRAIEMFVEACRQARACKAAFEDSFYPLTACSSGKDGCWDWPEGVWPPFN